VVGDKGADMLLAKAVGARSIHVATGKEPVSPVADYSANDLSGVVDIIMNVDRGR
jgi:phosphoglycolate phosphatase-like HAD superfamily hydrolase